MTQDINSKNCPDESAPSTVQLRYPGNFNADLLLIAVPQSGRRRRSICWLNTTKQHLYCVGRVLHQRRETGETFQTVRYSDHAPIALRIRVLSSLWLISSWAARSAAPVVRVCGWVWSWCLSLTETTNGIQTWLRRVHLDCSCPHRACVCVCHQKLSTVLQTDKLPTHANVHAEMCIIYAKARLETNVGISPV